MKSTRSIFYALFAVGALGLLAGCSDQPQSSAQTPAVAASGLPDFTALVQQAAPSVVQITTLPDNPERTGKNQSNKRGPSDQQRPLRKWLDRLLDPEAQGHHARPYHRHSEIRQSTGSGFIISEDGYILTARHVVAGAGQIVVQLNNRHQMTAELVGSDKYSGIAVLKIDAENLNPVEIGSVANLQPGAWVVAIGAPFGFETSVSAGVVSAKSRHLTGAQYVPFIQTDVAINPGNSGGPLFNLAGEVVGVNARIFSRSGGYQGLSFAIPIDLAMGVANQLIAGEGIERGWLGVQIQKVTLPLAQSFGMAWPHGALIAHIVPGTPAAASALKAGDVIVKYAGEPVANVSALPPLVGMSDPGETIEIVVFRNGDKQSIEVEIGKLNRSPWTGRFGNAHGEVAPAHGALGLRMRTLKDSEREQLGIPSGGVRILEVAPGSARRAGLHAGDVVAAVGSEAVAGPDALRASLSTSDGPVALRVLRDGGVLYIAFEPGS